MKHKKYKHIDNSYKETTLPYYKANGAMENNIEWIVTEKIHGTNFAFYIDSEETVKVASRNRFIDLESGFFGNNARIIYERYKENIIELYKNHDDINELILYGELFGGSYNHPDVKINSNVKTIQSGIQYTPNIDFIVFDVMINGKFMDYDLVMYLCRNFGIPVLPILFKGPYEQCKDYPNDFPTTIPEMYGLPEIEDNICEGVVLKPNIPYYIKDERVILKDKNMKFSEKKNKKTIKDKKKKLNERDLKIIEDLSQYINENRVYTVLSKHGDVHSKDFKDIWQKIKDDIYEEYGMISVDKESMQKIDKVVGSLVTDVWRPIYLQKRVD